MIWLKKIIELLNYRVINNININIFRNDNVKIKLELKDWEVKNKTEQSFMSMLDFKGD